jgi:hypothetical protein
MIRFEPSSFGREVAKLGVVTIGEVAPHHGGHRQRAWVRIFLPDVPKQLLPATSIEAAKQILEAKVRDWLEAADLVVAARVPRREAKGVRPDEWGWLP